ncbi:MAG: hypothetical protein HFE76_05240 [Firmicutes bacterium]|nr:hypothetical protein [Bacillota bacterium]
MKQDLMKISKRIALFTILFALILCGFPAVRQEASAAAVHSPVIASEEIKTGDGIYLGRYPQGNREDLEQSGDEGSEESGYDREEQSISCKSIFLKKYGADPFSLDAEAEGYLTYATSAPGVAEVSDDGIVTINGSGVAIITIRAEATEGYNEATKRIVIIVRGGGAADEGLRTIGNATVNPIAARTYTGQAIIPELVVKDGDTLLYEDEDYIPIYADNVNAGMAEVIIVGTGNYTGAITANFTIRKAVQSITGKSVITKNYGSKPFKLGAVAKTRISYKSSSQKTADVSPKGVVTLKNVGKTTITAVAAETKNYKRAKKNIIIHVKLKTPSFNLRWNGKDQIRLKWKSIPGADKYQILIYDAKKKKLLHKLTKNSNECSAVHSGIKKNREYWYKIRAYRIVDGKKVYSSFSSVKRIKILKR